MKISFKKGWLNMKKTTNPLKYIIIIITFVIIFVVVMINLYTKYKEVASRYEYNSIASRLKMLEWDKEDGYLKNVANGLYIDQNFESDFDEYWEFATIESYYLQGLTLKRAIAEGDTSRRTQLDFCIQKISDYVSTVNDQKLKNNAKSFLKSLTNN